MYPSKEQLEAKWWHRLVRVLIILLTIASFVFAFSLFREGFEGLFGEEFEGFQQFILSFEDGYNKVKAKEQNLEDYDFSQLILTDRIIERIYYENPPVLSKEGKKLYPREFIEKHCPPAPSKIRAFRTLYRASGHDCFKRIPENYPGWKIKIWTPIHPPMASVFLIVPITYFGLWFIYKKIILYIAFGKKNKTR